jgi:hypothetical protein
MRRSIKNSRGTKIGHLRVSHEGIDSEGTLLKKVECQVGDEEASYVLPKYGKIEYLDFFGLPPFHELSIGPERVENIQESYSSTDHKEEINLKVAKPSIAKAELEKNYKSSKEQVKVTEVGMPKNKSVTSIYEFKGDSKCNLVIDKDIRISRSGIKDLKQELTSKEREYLRYIRREERLPSVVILKTMKIDGSSPKATMKMYPFWEKQSYNNEIVRCLEIGYLDYGDNETNFDKKHGKWFKFMSFEDFDHSQLEIREGGWQSKEVEKNGESFMTLENYERHIYSI